MKVKGAENLGLICDCYSRSPQLYSLTLPNLTPPSISTLTSIHCLSQGWQHTLSMLICIFASCWPSLEWLSLLFNISLFPSLPRPTSPFP